MANACFSQNENYLWWNKKHQWDGNSPWFQYLNTVSGFMGPNALPIPELKGNSIADSAHLLIKYANHGGYGDETRNAIIEVFMPLIKNKVAFAAWMVPVEHFSLDENTRDQRKARSYQARGYAWGDLYFSSLINLISEKKWLPSATLECIIKTASGNNLQNARFTDTPGYVFTMHSSKTLFDNNQVKVFLQANTGFFAYQTYKKEHRQNDAFVYGLSLNLNQNEFGIHSGFKGYKGYFNQGDHPLVIFTGVYQCIGQSKLCLEFQHGIKDFPYQSVLIGIQYYPKFAEKILNKFHSKATD